MTTDDEATGEDEVTPEPPPEPKPRAKAAAAPPEPVLPSGPTVSVQTDGDGAGTGMFGQDADRVLSVALAGAPGEATFGESHVVGITRIDVSSSTPDATVLVAVVLK